MQEMDCVEIVVEKNKYAKEGIHKGIINITEDESIITYLHHNIVRNYKNPEEMFNARAKRMKEQGDEYWAKAKNGEGDYHYGKAKKAYASAEDNRQKAQKSKGKSW